MATYPIRITQNCKASIDDAKDYEVAALVDMMDTQTNLYEVLNEDEKDTNKPNRKVGKNRVYGDYDIYVKDDDEMREYDACMEIALRNVLSQLTTNDGDDTELPYSISSGSGFSAEKQKWKSSWRFVLPTFIGTKSSIKKMVCDVITPRINKVLTAGEAGFQVEADASVYKKGQKMRMMNSSKDGEDRPLRLIEGTLEDSLITYFPSTMKTICIDKEAQEDVQEVEVASTTSTNASEPMVLENVSEYLDILQHLNPNRYTKYEDWKKLGILIYNLGFPCDVWDEISKKAPGYQHGACAKNWAAFSNPYNKKQIGAGTLYMWLEEDDKSYYNQILSERKDMKNLVSFLNNHDAAQYFYSLNPDTYMYNQTLGWYKLTDTNIWEEGGDKRTPPKSLKRHISDVLQKAAIKFKNACADKMASEIKQTTDEDKIKTIKAKYNGLISDSLKAYKSFGQNDFTNGVIAFLDSYYEVPDLEAKLNQNRHIMAFDNCLFDFQSCTFRDIVPTDYITITTKYKYNKNPSQKAKDEVMGFLNSLFENTATRDYLLKVLAFSLWGVNRFEEFYIFKGKGANGKGAIDTLLQQVMGQYYYSISNNTITKPSEHKDEKMPQVVDGRFARMWMTTEIESKDKLQVGFLKKISGGDLLEARTLHSSKIYRFVPQFSLIIQTNDLPKLSKIDNGISRRLRVIDFPFRFTSSPVHADQRKGDPDVKEIKCKSEEWRDAFLQILLDVFIANKNIKYLDMPEKVVEATSEYMDDNNPVAPFLQECYTITNDNKDEVPGVEIRKHYAEWKKIPVENVDASWFGSMLRFNEINTKHTKKGNAYIGLKRIDE